ncbi:MAG: PHD/YefM family antitoxin component YafN of YafNO toxin-antitoxin module [Cryomorphaceae bacterium]|jgi:PHD/YefM family antitoxin component YafN of YafNO toxin-antitoxin module
MQYIDYIDAQAQLAKTMRRVCESEQPIAIDGAGKDSVVMIPLELFKQLKSETLSCWPQKLSDT